jgi:hypothetical protein
MKDVLKHIDVDGVQFPLVFNINVIEVMQEKYGTIQKWSDALSPAETVGEDGKKIEVEPKMSDIKFTYMEAINEGIDIENEEKGENRPFVTLKQVGRMLAHIMDAKGTIQNLVIESNDDGKEKN